MKFEPVRKMSVTLDIESKPRELGTLAWSNTERRAYFEYATEFLAEPLLVSPFHLMANAGIIQAPRDPFDGLHGLFNDSLPDGWGRMLLDRRLQRAGIDFHALTPLDRLSAVGTTGMGALSYIPEIAEESRAEGDLDWFVDQVALVQDQMDAADLDTLQGAQGGSAGARPKIMIGFDPVADSVVFDYGQGMSPAFEHWIVKSRSSEDPADIGAEEQAYALMARAAGIDMAETRLFETRKGNRLFATKRFDRTPAGRLHMHTASGLLDASHREPSVNYEMLHKLTWLMTRDVTVVQKMFRRMVFNVLSRNRDDHAKNHAFLMGADGQWRLSPAYDLTYSSGPGGEHSADVAGAGRAPDTSHMLKVAKAASIPPKAAHAIIDEVRTSLARWPEFAEEAGLPAIRTKELNSILTPG
ncbi:serine/threonine-protein kinase HipA [Neorhizobium huautlense]|uniref:Serine/threonine-protein kinase HipA n=1 Tax=Neorhizobium huautlense TaxID=67774 RepID=A0ABT9PVZ1_9HYPH|nr:type II toxin-antitoxin system HipA family toxin [Neorhizobium huautlense]MDP9838605.1 serine/threonine-protein kinase HipA [Neorhizobium huautlense]